MLRKLPDFVNRYSSRSSWTDFALTKFYPCAMGVFIGTGIPEKKKRASCTAASVFFATYIPLMARIFKLAKNSHEKQV